MSNARSLKIPSYRLRRRFGLVVVRLNGKDYYPGKLGASDRVGDYVLRA